MRRIWKPSSKASKAKHHKWARCERFTMGHDTACMSLLSEYDQMAGVKGSKHRHSNKIGVYRASSFGQTTEERMEADTIALLNSGRASSIEEAIAIVSRNQGNKDAQP